MASVKDIVKGAGGSVAEKLLIAPHQIDVVPGYNARVPGPDLDAHLDWLVGQIKRYGFDPNQPIEVQRNGDRFSLRHGHCRFAAVQRLLADGFAILTIPALLEPQGTNDLDRVYRMGNQNGSKPLSDLDYGDLVKRLRGFGQTDEQILEGYGKNAAWLRRILDLAGASHDVHQAVARKDVSATVAVDVVRRTGAKAGTVIKAAVEHARSEGRKHAKPRDVEAVTKPRDIPPSLCTLATAAVAAWRDSPETLDFQMAMEALELHLGPLVRKAA